MNLRIDLNEPRIREKVTSDRFGEFVSLTWKSYIDPYTPRDTGLMQENARIYPWKIHYIQKNYPEKVYYGYDMNFQKKNPYSTYEWDIKAAQAGQLDSLYRTLNNALQSGRF
ncbi:MAG: hypothetical protein U0M06_06710 [Clostridia bacterium]|nr:hypothetical protein [Clostridia bacterium]